jgi:predicted PurR-regulated permease PerM
MLVFILPFSLAAGTIIGNAEEISALSKMLVGIKLPAAPTWLVNLPLVGEKLGVLWQQVSTLTEAELAAKITPYSGMLLTWLAGKVGSLGMMMVQFILTIIIAAVLYSMGENASLLVRRFAHRLAGARGESTIQLAAQAIRGVALGVVVTALVQALLGGIGLIATGTPFVAILTAVMFVLTIAQIGVLPVLVPVIIWLYWKGDSGWATGLLVWAIMVSSIDNILRPVLIRRGADLPLMLIFVGVIGGLIAFGLIGIFVGPVVLAVAYKLLEAWIDEDEV